MIIHQSRRFGSAQLLVKLQQNYVHWHFDFIFRLFFYASDEIISTWTSFSNTMTTVHCNRVEWENKMVGALCDISIVFAISMVLDPRNSGEFG